MPTAPADPKQLALIECDVPLADRQPDGTFTANQYSQIPAVLDLLLAENVDANYQGERVLQLLRLQRADNFYRGIQNIAPSMDAATGALLWASYGSSGAPMSGTSDASDGYSRVFDYNPRLTAAYGQKFTSVLGQRTFYNTVASPLNPRSEIDRKGAKNVNLLIAMLHNQWNVEVLNYRLPYYLYKCGTTFGRLMEITDGEQCGYYTVQSLNHDKIDLPGGFTCPQCGDFTPGAPSPDGLETNPFCRNCLSPLTADTFTPPATINVTTPGQTQQFPRSSVSLTLENGYIITHPFNVVELEKGPWVVEEWEEDIGNIYATHPNARYLLKNTFSTSGATGAQLGDTSAVTAAIVRATAQSQTGTIRARNTSLRTYRHTWLAASQLEMIQDDAQRELIKATFPNGVRITKAEGVTIAIKGRKFSDYINPCMPQMADYQFADGSSWGMQGLEDGISNLVSIAMETYETGITKFLVNPDYASVNALNRNRYSPNRFIPALPKFGDTLANAFATFPASDPPQGLPETAGMLKDFIEGFLGLMPAVYGDIPPNMTLGGVRTMLTQGLLQLATTAALMSDFWAQADTNAVKLYLKLNQPNPEWQGNKIDLDLIRNSNWVIKGGSTMPRSYAEKKETLQEIVTQNPDMAKALRITDPVNYPALDDYLDLPELKNSASEMVLALNEIMDQLWNGQPQQQPQPDGSIKTVPSIAYDPMVFDPQITVNVAQQFLLEDFDLSKIATPGFANVHAFLEAAHDALKDSNQPQPQPPKLSLSLDLSKTPPPQEMAVLQKYGINVPQVSPVPSIDTANKMVVNEQKHQQGIEKSEIDHAHNLERAAANPAPALGPGGTPVSGPPNSATPAASSNLSMPPPMQPPQAGSANPMDLPIQ